MLLTQVCSLCGCSSSCIFIVYFLIWILYVNKNIYIKKEKGMFYQIEKRVFYTKIRESFPDCLVCYVVRSGSQPRACVCGVCICGARGVMRRMMLVFVVSSFSWFLVYSVLCLFWWEISKQIMEW